MTVKEVVSSYPYNTCHRDIKKLWLIRCSAFSFNDNRQIFTIEESETYRCYILSEINTREKIS
jgi:hypothetical protein